MNKKLDKAQRLPRRILGSDIHALQVSALGFGAMGMTYHRGPVKDEKSMVSLLHEAIDYGCIFFDTAEIYGPYTNEDLLGRALLGIKEISVATKFGHKISQGKACYGELDSSPETIRKSCEGSLRRLKRDTIDIYYQHRVDPFVPIETVAETVKELISEGKVRHFGLCEADEETIRRAHTVQPLTAVQSEYNLMWRKPEKIFPVLEELGIGFVPYSPLNRGFLAGGINCSSRFNPANDNRATLPRFTPSAIKQNLKIVDVLDEFGRCHGLSVPQVHLGWMLSKAPWIVPIPGTTIRKHMEENFSSAFVQVPKSDWERLEEAISKIPVFGERYSGVEKAQAS